MNLRAYLMIKKAADSSEPIIAAPPESFSTIDVSSSNVDTNDLLNDPVLRYEKINDKADAEHDKKVQDDYVLGLHNSASKNKDIIDRIYKGGFGLAGGAAGAGLGYYGVDSILENGRYGDFKLKDLNPRLKNTLRGVGATGGAILGGLGGYHLGGYLSPSVALPVPPVKLTSYFK